MFLLKRKSTTTGEKVNVRQRLIAAGRAIRLANVIAGTYGTLVDVSEPVVAGRAIILDRCQFVTSGALAQNTFSQPYSGRFLRGRSIVNGSSYTFYEDPDGFAVWSVRRESTLLIASEEELEGVEFTQELRIREGPATRKTHTITFRLPDDPI